jgi:type VI secretion system secreted protein Hcp
MAFNAFLKIRDSAGNILIQGESTDKSHPREIVIDSFSWGLASTGGAAPAVQDLQLTAPMSKASPNLMLACATGRRFPEADLTLRKATSTGQIEFVKLRFFDALISSYNVGGNHATGLPEDQFSIAFDKIDFLYTVSRTGEMVETSFDFSAVKG